MPRSDADRLLALLELPDRLAALEERLASLVEAIELDPAHRLLTKGELAAVLSVSERTIDNLRREGLPVVMVGAAPRFVAAEAIAWLKTRGEQADAPALRLVEPEGGTR